MILAADEVYISAEGYVSLQNNVEYFNKFIENIATIDLGSKLDQDFLVTII